MSTDVSGLLGLLLELRDSHDVRWVQLEGNREGNRWPWTITVETNASADSQAFDYAAHGVGNTPEEACANALSQLRAPTTKAKPKSPRRKP